MCVCVYMQVRVGDDDQRLGMCIKSTVLYSHDKNIVKKKRRRKKETNKVGVE